MLIAVASNLRRSKRTAGKQITDLDRRVRRLQKNPAPRRLAARAVTSTNLAQNAVTPVELAPSVNTAILNAQTAASGAQTAASGAQASANGKNKITYSTGVPGSTANTAGDIWWQYNNLNVIIGQWTGLGGTSWQANTIGNTVIANLDAGKITVGILSGREVVCEQTFIPGLAETYVTKAQMLANGSIYSRFSYSGLNPSFQTEVFINNYETYGNGIYVTGNGSGSTKYVQIVPSLISTNGNIICADLTETSDARIKENVEDLATGAAIDVVKSLRPVTYNYTLDGKSSHGFIAQEVYEVCKDFVKVGGEDPATDPWGISYTSVIPALTSALQSCIAKIDDLEARLSALEN